MPTQTAGLDRYFTTPDQDPFDSVEWDIRDAWPNNEEMRRRDVEVPASWSQEALDITSKLYLARGEGEETSIRNMILRVSHRIMHEGFYANYFGGSPATDPDYSQEAEVFAEELRYILVNQMASFNSPVWFNIGRADRPQCPSACFLLGVDDNSDSIMNWATEEAFIFKAGAGSGANLSNIRGSMEPLSPGGVASGPVSFMRVADSVAGTFKSGGTTRRAAKLVCLDDDHPDLLDFIHCKRREEERLRLLAAAGINISMDLEGERNVAEMTSYQNANNSVRLSDEFMERANRGEDWHLTARKTGEVVETVNASHVLDEIAQAAWDCADPGVQFNDTINAWHTTPADGPIRTSNPCSETMLSDNSSCNLASINVLKFVQEDGSFDVAGFNHVVDVMITAMDILVEFCELPTKLLTERTKMYRWLGLGYSNMGAAIMAKATPYDSPEARDFAASVTALMTGRAYKRSAELACEMGPFDGYEKNAVQMKKVIHQHADELPRLDQTSRPIWVAADAAWESAKSLGERHGYRNAQATVIAPTGSISFLMDCDTSGIEPAWELVTHKSLAGGGNMTLVNKSVKRSLSALGYTDDVSDALVLTLINQGYETFLMGLGTDDRAAVFHGANEISAEGHVRMVAAVQPFISGCISKTVNMPSSATTEDIRSMYSLAWQLGCKAMAIYRNGSKARQPLTTKTVQTGKGKVEVLPGTVRANSGPHPPPEHLDEVELMTQEVWESGLSKAETPHAEDQYEGAVSSDRQRMPRDASMHRHKFNVGGHEGYLLMGEYEDGSLGEIFLEDIGKEGSHVRGMANAWAISLSIGLQYGTSLETLVRKYTNMNFEPNGPTENPLIPNARSIPDYIARVLAHRYLPHLCDELGILTEEVRQKKVAQLDAGEMLSNAAHFNSSGELNIDVEMLVTDMNKKILDGFNFEMKPTSNGHKPLNEDMGPPCECGAIMVRTGTCFTCRSCYASSGCG